MFQHFVWNMFYVTVLFHDEHVIFVVNAVITTELTHNIQINATVNELRCWTQLMWWWNCWGRCCDRSSWRWINQSKFSTRLNTRYKFRAGKVFIENKLRNLKPSIENQLIRWLFGILAHNMCYLTLTNSKESPVILMLCWPTLTVNLNSPSEASLVEKLCSKTLPAAPRTLWLAGT